MEENNNIKNEENSTKKLKTRKIGRFTFGIVLVLIGILIFVQTFTTIDTLRYIMMLSPLIFISLGLEVLILSRKNDIKYDFIGVILTFLTLGAGWIFAGINYGVNKVLYDDNFVSFINKELSQEKFYYVFDEGIKVSNISDKKINLEIVENKDNDYTTAYVEFKYKRNSDDEIIETLIDSINKNKVVYDIDFENKYLMFIDVDDDVESIEVKVVTNNKDNVKYEGNFNELK